MTLLTSHQWDDFLTQFPDAHLLQTSTWASLKALSGWDAARVVVGDVGAQVLFRRLPLGLSIAYIPRGPLGANWEALLPDLDAVCRRRRAVFLKIEPDCWEPAAGNIPPAPPAGFIPGMQTIQPPRTLVVDLTGDEAAVLGRMKQKTRYNVRLALKRGVVVRPSADLQVFHQLMQITGERDRFGVHSRAYYQQAYEYFHPLGLCELLLAEAEGTPLAAMMIFGRGARAWYFYGASSDQFREWMPTYLLQWEAMRWARARGCSEYDLWGVPDADEPVLEAGFSERSDGLWGVYRFKRGFGGVLRRAAGPWDRVYNPVLYKLYSLWLRRSTRE